MSEREWRIYSDPTVEGAKIPLPAAGESKIGTGYIYAPYIPLYMTPGTSEVTKSPLEEFFEEVFKEEIEEGKLVPIVREAATEFKISAAMRKKFKQIVINPAFFGPVKIENM